MHQCADARVVGRIHLIERGGETLAHRGIGAVAFIRAGFCQRVRRTPSRRRARKAYRVLQHRHIVGIARQKPETVARPMHGVFSAQSVEHLNRRIFKIIVIQVWMKLRVSLRRAHCFPQCVFSCWPQ